jgi:hypothetical protein
MARSGKDWNGRVMHQIRRETAARFRSDMARLLRGIAALPADRQDSIVFGDWTIKDILIHIPAWDRELVRGLDDLLGGRMPAFAGYSEDEFSARAVEAARDASFADVLVELRSAHEALVSRIESLTDEEWLQASPYRWGNGTPMTVTSLFDYTYNGDTHYGGHARQIEDWLARQAGTRS